MEQTQDQETTQPEVAEEKLETPKVAGKKAAEKVEPEPKKQISVVTPVLDQAKNLDEEMRHALSLCGGDTARGHINTALAHLQTVLISLRDAVVADR